ncbi:zinc finger, CCHC-type containing protein [Tanacetum coccineum]|uniref:Zinc finger, CCHC-type containing protein n=1 Tax=Tanacetum coccineum TaxID=301880 RepID=A0ABQ5GTW5_9ASTR
MLTPTIMILVRSNRLRNGHYKRLGHVHFKRMQDMSKDGLIPAFDMEIKKCKTCMLTKITKKPFQNVKRKTKVLELIHSDLYDLHATPSLGNKKYFVAFIDDASRAVVRLLDPKMKTLGERGLECIFVGYAKHSKAFRFFVIEPNELVSINSIIELRDGIFDENRFSSVPRPSLSILKGTKDIGGSVVPEKVTEEVVQQPEPELRKSKRKKTPKEFRRGFQLYLIEGTKDEKEAINDEMDSILGNNAWVLADLPPGCKPLACKWIFKRKLKMDVKTAFLNGVLDEEVYMNQPQGFIIPGNENKSHYIEKVLKKFNYFDCTPVSTPMDTSEKLMPNNGQAVSQLKYSRVIGCLMYAMTCTRPDIAFAMGKLSILTYTGYPSMVEITLMQAGSATLKTICLPVASQMYNGKSRYLSDMHSMIRELITNRVISVEFVRSQQNLADHLTKGLARDLVIKSAEGMSLKSN